jgi:hypothetical protein
MLLELVLWTFLILLSTLALDLALELTFVIVQGLASILRKLSARSGNADRLASQSWSQPSSR